MQKTHALKRSARKFALTTASPIDRAALLLNGKRGFPPVALRRQNGPLNTYERVAGEYVAYLVTLAGLGPSSHVLDVGCGAGAMPLVLRERLEPSGEYIGFDVDKATAAWCKKRLGGDRFHFHHHDYWNATYNPHGKKALAWPVADHWADVILLKSIFTHMLPEDVEFYVREIARTLTTHGTALVTAFLYMPGKTASGRHHFPLEGDRYRYNNPASPESAIALQEPWLRSVIESAGLKVEVLPGLWRDNLNERPFAYQDILLITNA